MSSRLGRVLVLALCVVIGAAAVGSVPAATGRTKIEARYGLYWAGFQIATIDLAHRLDQKKYRAQAIIETVGLVELLTGYRGRARVAGRRGEGRLVPVVFRNEDRSRRKTRRTVVKYDPDNGDVVDLKITKRGKPDRSKVPEKLQKSVVDPLTAFFSLRQAAAAAQAGSPRPFFAAVFDGRRRYDMEGWFIGRDRRIIAGREWPILRFRLTLTMLAGANRDDLTYAGADEDRLELEFLISDDQELLPLRLSTRDTIFPARIELLRNCPDSADCRLNVSG